jgi:CHAT domain-containing protein/Tfp pilus assembly protein PilF
VGLPTAARSFIVLLTVCVALSASYAFAGEAEWQAHDDAGTAAYQRGDYRTATTHFEASLREAESFGANDLRLATSLNNLAHMYAAQGLYAEAEPLYRQSLAIAEKTLAPDHPGVGTSLNNLAALYHNQGRYAEAEPLYQRDLAISERALGPDHPSVGTALNNLAGLYRAQGRFPEAEPLYRRSLRIYEKAFGPEHANVGTALNNLAVLYDAQGRNAEAEPLYRRSLAIREKALGPDHPSVGTSLNNLAVLYDAQGRYAEAEPLYRRSLAIAEKALGPDHPSVGTTLDNLAWLYEVQGRYAEAEPLYRRSLTIREKALGREHPDVGRSLNKLAGLYRAQGRYAEAEPLYRRSLAIAEKALGPEHPDVGVSLHNTAVLYEAQGRYAEAEPPYRRTLGIIEKALGSDHPNLGTALSSLAGLYRAQGRYAEAEPLYRRSLAIAEKALGPDHPSVGTTLNNLAGLFDAQGRYAEAEPIYRRSLAIREKILGPDHPSVGRTLANLAVLYGQQKRWGEGLALARRATLLLAARFAARSESGRGAVLAEQGIRSGEFELHVALLHEARGGETNAAVESFEVAQLARASDTADQVANMAARYAGGSDALAQLARARQDAVARLQALDARIVQASSRAPKDRSAETEARLRTESDEAKNALITLGARMEKEFPQYRELTNPKPLKLAAAQKFLGEDEALVLLLVSDAESYLWVLRRREAGFFKLDIKRSELVETVKKLRAQLDLGAGDPEQMLAKPFDVAAAHDLYRKIFGPAEKLLGGVKHLIFVPDGAMQSLPPGVLVADAPAKPTASLGEHAQVGWLTKKYAITVLPAASSLRALRQFARTPTSMEPFGGFGDPVLEGGGEARGKTIAALYSRGAVADASEVRKLARLPESAGELRAIAAALKAPASSIRLAAAATERAVKEADLSRYRNLAFATHGLMAGDFKGLAEPALVLTPPEKGSELDDGLLTAGEISQLKLDADWVILSACNTAAPDGTPGAEGLSGLARAFFYAGARSLLVSHWSVSSDAAVALTTRMFDESAKGTTKAEALRRSMLALMQTPGKPQFAHPAFWAPFVVVGEGGSEARK